MRKIKVLNKVLSYGKTMLLKKLLLLISSSSNSNKCSNSRHKINLKAMKPVLIFWAKAHSLKLIHSLRAMDLNQIIATNSCF